MSSSVDPRLFVLVGWEAAMKRWARAARSVLGAYFFLAVVFMACSPFVVVALAVRNPWLFPALLGAGLLASLVPAAVSALYRVRIARLRTSL